jgi:hypothetical protein
MDRGTLITLLALTLLGGMLGNFGPSMLMRSNKGRAFVCSWKWWGVLLYVFAVGAVVAAIVAWAYFTVVSERETVATLESPLFFFVFGLAAGLPFSLTTLLSVRRTASIAAERAKRKKPASKQERLDFAKNLEEQLREFSDDLNEARVRVKGKESTVVAIHGGVTREQAERLVNVLRGDLLDLGIQRVESGEEGDKWWVRVK